MHALTTSTLLASLALGQPAPGAPGGFDLEATLTAGDAPLTPVEAVEQAWAVAPEIEAARARVDAAQSTVDAARVPLVPRLTLSGNVERIGGFPDGAFETPMGEVTIEVPRNRAGVTAELAYPLTRVFFGVLPQLDSAEARAEAESHRAAATRDELALQALEAYWTHARARGGLAVARSSLKQAEAQRDRLVVMLDAGLATPADVAAAEARYAEATQAVVRAQGADDVARSTLALLLGRPEGQAVAFPAAVLEPPGPSAAPASALEDEAARHRPELLALASAQAAVEEERKSLWTERLPRLDVRGAATYAQPNPNVIPPEAQFDPSWSVGARLSWSPSDLWSAELRADRTSADVARLSREYDQLWRQVRIQLRAESTNLEASRRAWAAALARVEAAEESYRARLAAFRNGRAIFAEVLEADAELSAARQSQLDALVAAHLARARLNRAVGRSAMAGSNG